MSSFFLPAKSSSRERKRKRPIKAGRKKSSLEDKKTRKKAKVQPLEEEIASDSDADDNAEDRRPEGAESEEEEEESAPEKRLRLAKEYLQQLEEEEQSQQELAQGDHDAIAHRLREDVLQQAGRLQRKVADLYSAPAVDSIRVLRGHQLPVTCVAMTPDDRHIYSGSKDCSIIKWDVASGKKVVIFTGRRGGGKGEGRGGGKGEGIVGHTGHVLALAISSDGKFLASGGHDKVIHIWDVQNNVHLHTFSGHRGAVSGLVFQRGTHELFSCAFDRTVKLWNVDEMAYVETLFGHQDSVSAIDCLGRQRPVTAGMNDRSVRLWKVVEESQLVFQGHNMFCPYMVNCGGAIGDSLVRWLWLQGASIDCVRLINEEHFVTGSQDGILSVWSIMKKKPLVSSPHHLQEEVGGVTTPPSEYWVTAVAAYTSSDLIATGSSDGYVRLWKCGEFFRSVEPLFSVPLQGYANSLAFSHRGDVLVVGVGQEHRLGRWCRREKAARNSVAIIPLTRTTG